VSESTYEGPIVTADAIYLRRRVSDGKALEVCLHVRPSAPFAGVEALPGVFVQRGETSLQAAQRALYVKAAQPSSGYHKCLGVSDAADRDPRGPSMSVTYLFIGPGNGVVMEGTRWVDVNDLLDLAFDHAQLIENALTFVRQNFWHDRDLALALLGSELFTTAGIAAIMRSLGVDVNLSNLRVRMQANGMFRSKFADIDGRGRPAYLWSFHPEDDIEFWNQFDSERHGLR
jgi:8-oxo-dGTP diphosphatase